MDNAEKELARLRTWYLSRAKPGERVQFHNCPNCDYLLGIFIKEQEPSLPPDPPPKPEVSEG